MAEKVQSKGINPYPLLFHHALVKLIFMHHLSANNMTWEVFQWLLYGGLAYTLGVIFYKNQKLLYSHAIWHLFVLAGSILHFFAVIVYLTPLR